MIAVKSKAAFVVVFVVLIVGIFGLVAWSILDLQRQRDDLTERLKTQNGTVQLLVEENAAITANAQRLFDQLQALPGVEPDGDDPADVAREIPAPGATGARGDRGPGPTSAEVAAGLAAFCAPFGVGCAPPGRDGTNGTNGTNGADGLTVVGPVGPAGPEGPASTVPGPVGPAGPAGPTCPDGYNVSVLLVETYNPDTGETTPVNAAVCTPLVR